MKKSKVIKNGNTITHLIIFNKKYKITKPSWDGEVINSKYFSIYNRGYDFWTFIIKDPKIYNVLNKGMISAHAKNPITLINKIEKQILKLKSYYEEEIIYLNKLIGN